MYPKILLVILLITVWCDKITLQRTVGLIRTSADVYDGYTLFAPINAKETYLIDNCGYLINKWTSSHFPGQSAHVLPNGDLLRTGRIAGAFTGGGLGGKIEIFAWNGELKWSYIFATAEYHQHHVAYPMPNGNILIILWKKYSKEQAIQHGFDPAKLTNQGIWSDKIIEFTPLPDNNIEIVWEWDFWDHTIQHFDPDKNNFGIISDHPELLDVNFSEDPGANVAEWIHANSLDYDSILDQIIISSKFHNEYYIIDHSTTAQEASGHTGGKYGKGGDFLYRWGNPRSYGRGNINDHWLYGQHDVQWIKQGLPGEGNILLFNNGSNRTGELYSTVEEMKPPVTDTGTYVLEIAQKYGPDKPLNIYQGKPRTSFYSSRISGVQRLPNGNTLVCEGNKGNFFEVDKDDNIVWQYKNPVNNFGPATQGSQPINIDVFKIIKYSNDYPAFEQKDLSPKGTVEFNQGSYDCLLVNTDDSYSDIFSDFVYPNPAENSLYLRHPLETEAKYTIYDVTGREILSSADLQTDHIDISHLQSGFYYLNVIFSGSTKMINFVFIKK